MADGPLEKSSWTLGDIGSIYNFGILTKVSETNDRR